MEARETSYSDKVAAPEEEWGCAYIESGQLFNWLSVKASSIEVAAALFVQDQDYGNEMPSQVEVLVISPHGVSTVVSFARRGWESIGMRAGSALRLKPEREEK